MGDDGVGAAHAGEARALREAAHVRRAQLALRRVLAEGEQNIVEKAVRLLLRYVNLEQGVSVADNGSLHLFNKLICFPGINKLAILYHPHGALHGM